MPPVASVCPVRSDQLPPGRLLISRVAPPRTLIVPLANDPALPKTSVPASGAGNSGLATFFQSVGLALNLEFDNGVRVLMSGVE
jgi:hypothetical protein